MNISITSAQLYTIIGQFVQAVIGTDPATSQTVVVTRGQINLVAMPDSAFVNMQLFTMGRLRTNVHTYTVDQQMEVEVGTKVKVRLDFYGPLAEDWSRGVTALWRDDYGCAFLASVGAPLYDGDPMQAALVNGEEQYENRWIVEMYLQYNPVITVPQQSATTFKVKVKNVDETFPP
jgi:hypothetical protein